MSGSVAGRGVSGRKEGRSVGSTGTASGDRGPWTVFAGISPRGPAGGTLVSDGIPGFGKWRFGELFAGDARGDFDGLLFGGARSISGGRCQPVGWLPGLSKSSMPTTVASSNTRGTAQGRWRRHGLLRGANPGQDVGTKTGA